MSKFSLRNKHTLCKITKSDREIILNYLPFLEYIYAYTYNIILKRPIG